MMNNHDEDEDMMMKILVVVVVMMGGGGGGAAAADDDDGGGDGGVGGGGDESCRRWWRWGGGARSPAAIMVLTWPFRIFQFQFQEDYCLVFTMLWNSSHDIDDGIFQEGSSVKPAKLRPSMVLYCQHEDLVTMVMSHWKRLSSLILTQPMFLSTSMLSSWFWRLMVSGRCSLIRKPRLYCYK